MNDLTRWLFTTRRKYYLTQEEVGEAIGVKQTTIGRWEAGQTSPKFTDIQALCTFFGESFTINP